MIYIVVFVAYAYGLWRMSIPLTGDQKVYLSIALEMAQRRDWSIPFLWGEPNFLKPPLQYWATLLGWKVFGMNPWGSFFPSVLAWLLTLPALFRFFPKISPDLKSEQIRDVVLFCSATFATMTFATTAQMEVWLIFFWMWSWVFALEKKWIKTGISLGALLLVKGPLYPALFGLSLLGIYRTKIWTVWPAVIAAGIVGLPWFGWAYQQYPDAFIRAFIMQENVGKIAGNGSTPWGLVRDFLLNSFPALFMVFSFSFRLERLHSIRWKIFLATSLPFFVFFLVFPYRVSTYLFPLTPWLALILIQAKSPESTKTKILMGTRGGLYGIMLLLGLGFFFFWQHHWMTFVTFLVLFVACSGVVLGVMQEKLGMVLLGALLMVTGIRSVGLDLGESDLDPLRQHIAQKMPTKVALVVPEQTIWNEFGWLSVGIGRPVQPIRLEDSVLWSDPDSLVIFDEESLPDSRWKCVPWPRLKKRIKFPWNAFLNGRVDRDGPDVTRWYSICQIKGV